MQRILRRVNSKLALRDVSRARSEYSQFLDWKNYMLRLHAAEVYADMHGEYISIGASTALVYFLSCHPMYNLGFFAHATTVSIEQTLIAAAFQLCTGLLFDYLSSVVEGVHEVPLYETVDDEGRGLRFILIVVLGTVACINVGGIALFYLGPRTPVT